MFKLFLVVFISFVIHVQTYKYKPKHYYPPAPPQSQSDAWWYDMGDDWEVSNKLSEVSPSYGWYQQAAAQMDKYGYATHVGKIDRGQFFNPELNMPSDRAFGYQSDFNPVDFNSGAFNRKPQGQKIRANDAHVNEGLASYVGEIVTMPIGQHLQEDGSILVQVSYTGEDPCQPNPCTNVRMPTCTVVNRFTAKCTRSDDYKLSLTWSDPNGDDTDIKNNLNLLLVPAYHDGTPCAAMVDYYYVDYDLDYCGASISSDDYTYYDDTPNMAEETATLTTLDDGTNYKRFTYAVIAYVKDIYNLSEGGPTLTVEYNGEVKQILAIPQYDDVTNLNYGTDLGGANRIYYFFGCFRPQLGYVDTRGAGFHDDNTLGAGSEDTEVIDGLGIFAPGLCQATLGWTGGYGFNPYDQSGSGDETGSG